MSYTPEEMRRIENADGQRGWSAIPDGCPLEIRTRIVEYRAKAMGIQRDPQIADARATLDAVKSLSVA
jgi:hypothetical protein